MVCPCRTELVICPCVQAVENMFDQIAEPDSISYETVVAAVGTAGQADRAEAWLEALRDAGHHPRDYTFTALVAAHRLVCLLFEAADKGSSFHRLFIDLRSSNAYSDDH